MGVTGQTGIALIPPENNNAGLSTGVDVDLLMRFCRVLRRSGGVAPGRAHSAGRGAGRVELPVEETPAGLAELALAALGVGELLRRGMATGDRPIDERLPKLSLRCTRHCRRRFAAIGGPADPLTVELLALELARLLERVDYRLLRLALTLGNVGHSDRRRCAAIDRRTKRLGERAAESGSLHGCVSC